jgi:hypothetical protein
MKPPESHRKSSDRQNSDSSAITDPEDEDKKFLSANKHDIDKILKLIEDKTDRTEAERRLSEAQTRVDAKKQGSIFHQRAGGAKKIALNHHTSNLIKLSDALELSLTTLDYRQDLHTELETLLERRIEVLRRMKKRRT